MTRPFRFGQAANPTMASAREWTDLAKRVEGLGYSVLTIADHFGTSGGIWSALVSAHTAAPALRVGTLMLNNDLWHPSVIAREAVTTDVLTDGALELGIGAGWNTADYLAAGIRRDRPALRISRLAESIQIVKQVLAGQTVSFHGAQYEVSADRAWPRPRQSPVPLVLGGGGRRMLQLAARNAATVSVSRNLERGAGPASWLATNGKPIPQADQVSERVNWVRAAAGDRWRSLELHALIRRAVVTNHRAETAESLGAPLGLTADEVLSSPTFLVGSLDQMIEDLLDRRERWGFSYLTILSLADADAFAGVVSRLRGV